MHPSAPNLSIAVSHDRGDTVLALEGELDIHTTAQLAEQLADLVHDGRLRLVVDLARLDFVDSTGLGALVGEFARVQRGGGDMSLRAATPAVRRTIEVTGLQRALPVRD